MPGVLTRQVRGRDRSYGLLLSAPDGAPPPGGWPTLWVLDADLYGLILMESARRLGRRPDVTGVMPMAVVGVAPGEDQDPRAARHRDFSPGPSHLPLKAEISETGGAADFLEIFETSLMDAAEQAGASRKTPMIWGHSLSGYFALWAAARRPDLFSAVAAISPSLWWDEAALEPLVGCAPRLFFAVGEREFDDRPGDHRMISRLRGLHARVEGSGGVAELRVMPEEDHASIVPASAAAALRSLCRRP